MSEIEANFKTLNKALLNIGQNLYSSKEARELFVNVVDKVLEEICGLRIECCAPLNNHYELLDDLYVLHYNIYILLNEHYTRLKEHYALFNEPYALFNEPYALFMRSMH